MGNCVYTRAAFEKISKNFEAEGRTSENVQFSTQIQVKTKKKKKAVTAADVHIFAEIQRRTEVKTKQSSSVLDHVRC